MEKQTNTQATLRTREDLFRQKAETYLVCFADTCPRHADCLRWQVGQYTPTRWPFVHCVNPHYGPVSEAIAASANAADTAQSPDNADSSAADTAASTAACDLYTSAQPVLMARGMTRTFTDQMPPRVTRHVRQSLIAEVNRPYFYQYRNGSRLIPPALQHRIRQLFREAGWEQEIDFDGYVEDFEW